MPIKEASQGTAQGSNTGKEVRLKDLFPGIDFDRVYSLEEIEKGAKEFSSAEVHEEER